MTLEGNVAEPIRKCSITLSAPEFAWGTAPVIRRGAIRIGFPIVRRGTAQDFSHSGADRHPCRAILAELTPAAFEPARRTVVEFVPIRR